MNRQLRFENLEQKELLATVMVTSVDDAGGGTLRDAIEQANVDPEVDRIKFVTSGNFRLDTPLVYTGSQKLVVNVAPERRSHLRPTDLNTEKIVLISSGGGDLQINKLTFHDSLVAIKVEVPLGFDQHNTLNLREVHFRNNTSLISMMENRDTGDDSSSGDLRLRLKQISVHGKPEISGARIGIDEFGDGNAVVIVQNGNSYYGRDFLRVSEHGTGSARVVVNKFALSGSNGIGIAENDAGRVFFSSTESQYYAPNGYSNAVNIAETGGGSLEVHVDGSLFDGHGIRLRENGSGPLNTTVLDSSFNDAIAVNAFEADGGNLAFSGVDIDSDNGSFWLYEDQNGHLDIDARSMNVTNVKDAFQINEKGNGFVRSTFRDVYVNTSEVLAPFTAQSISINESDAGGIKATFERVHLGGVEFKSIPESAIEMISTEEGRIFATVIDSVFNDVETGIIAIQDDDDPFDFGSLELTGGNVFRAENEFELLNVNLV